MNDESPGKQAARELMLRDFERIGNRYHAHAEEQWELLRERQDLEELWRLAGLGEPPVFQPSIGIMSERRSA